MKKWFIIIGVVVNLFSASATLAQINLNNVSVNIGKVRELMYSYQDRLYLVYPELQLSGDFLIPSIRWTVSWGYWTDGEIKKNQVEYSDYIHIVGARFTFLPKKLWNNWDLPMGIFIGVSQHFFASKNTGWMTASYIGSPEQYDLKKYATTFDIGLIAEVQVLGPFGIRGEIQTYGQPRDGVIDYLSNFASAIKVGIFYTF